jgi:hypothetical protein
MERDTHRKEAQPDVAEEPRELHRAVRQAQTRRHDAVLGRAKLSTVVQAEPHDNNFTCWDNTIFLTVASTDI